MSIRELVGRAKAQDSRGGRTKPVKFFDAACFLAVGRRREKIEA